MVQQNLNHASASPPSNMPNKGDGQMRPEQHEWQNLDSDKQAMIDEFLRYDFDANYIAR